ncbi:MAG: hypothetical protein RLN75_04610 [Longimicrobiales bacterium]
MRLTPWALVAAVAAGAFAPVSAQEAPESPRFLLVASFICPLSAVAEIAQTYEATMKPVEEELVAEGVLAAAGLYFHAFSDEWNVHHFRAGYDPGDLITAAGTANQRLLERHPDLRDDMSGFAACSAHKDNIYGVGPGTGRPDMFPATNGGNPPQ